MSVEISIRKNKYNLNLNDLIVMGKRINNEKRNFLLYTICIVPYYAHL